MKARIALMGGMGFPATETWAGLPNLEARLKALGPEVEVLLVGWSERQAVYNFMRGYGGFRAYCGDSLGAGSAAQYPGDVDGGVDFCGGFQPSLYDARSHNGFTEVARNVVRAFCIYDPRWIDTMGLGASQYRTAFNATTKLTVVAHHGAHPDDWGFSQDLMFNAMKGLMGA